MKQDNIIQKKSYDFALKTVTCYQSITLTEKEWVLSKQLLRSGTSIGANVEEAIGGQSKKDFVSKLSIAYKEARETRYWLRLLRDSSYLDPDKAQELLHDCDELLRILGSILKTSKSSCTGQ